MKNSINGLRPFSTARQCFDWITANASGWVTVLNGSHGCTVPISCTPTQAQYQLTAVTR